MKKAARPLMPGARLRCRSCSPPTCRSARWPVPSRMRWENGAASSTDCSTSHDLRSSAGGDHAMDEDSTSGSKGPVLFAGAIHRAPGQPRPLPHCLAGHRAFAGGELRASSRSAHEGTKAADGTLAPTPAHGRGEKPDLKRGRSGKGQEGARCSTRRDPICSRWNTCASEDEPDGRRPHPRPHARRK